MKLVAVIEGPTQEEAFLQIERARQGADLLELRSDLLEEVPRSLPLPFMVTVKQEEKVEEWLQLKPLLCDLPWDWEINRWKRAYPDVSFVASYHHFDKTPSSLEELWEQMQQEGVSYYKIAARANSGLDCLQLMQWAHRHPNCIAVAMGEWGEASRLWGSPFSYVRVKSAPSPLGQLRLEEMRNDYRFPRKEVKRLYGLIGDPVHHSMGHRFHNALFPLDALYLKLRIGSGELAPCWDLLKTLPFQGFSVTMPHKETMAQLLGEDKGPINTVIRRGGEWIGANTDGEAALSLLGDVGGKKIAILGRGGVGKAIGAALEKAGAEILFYGRNRPIDGNAYQILIQATPVGMEGEELPLDPDQIREGCCVLEVVQRFTPFLREAEKRGCTLIRGEELFTRQALLQQKLWQESDPVW